VDRFAEQEIDLGSTGLQKQIKLDRADEGPAQDKRGQKQKGELIQHQQLQFGISLQQADNPWNKTNLITIVP